MMRRSNRRVWPVSVGCGAAGAGRAHGPLKVESLPDGAESLPERGRRRPRCLALAAAWLALGLLGYARPAPAAEPPRPNILFILADQYRYDCVGINGNPDIHTPHLDRLARGGVRFDRAYAAQPVCSPNRATILTGLYPHRAGVQENNVSLPSSSRTLAEILAPAGYECGYFGKWHLGRRDAFEIMPEYPHDGRGTQHYFGRGKDKQYSVDVITADAIAFLKKPHTRPFYLYVSYYPPHPPYSAPDRFIQRYQHIQDRKKRIYYAMCQAVDEAAGKLIQTLDEINATEHTLVVFTTDHGHNFIHRWNDHEKRVCYDSAARLPLIMRLPGVLPEDRRIEGLIGSVDLVPTLLALVGRPIPAGLDGQDFSALARGKTEHGRKYLVIENVPYVNNTSRGEERCIMTPEWKLILNTHRPPELINYLTDPDETNNRYEQLKDSALVTALKTELAAWAQKTEDKLAPTLLEALDR